MPDAAELNVGVWEIVSGDVGLEAEPNQRKGPFCGPFSKRLKGLEPSTFCMASRRSSQLSYSRRRAQYSRGPGPFDGRCRAARPTGAPADHRADPIRPPSPAAKRVSLSPRRSDALD